MCLLYYLLKCRIRGANGEERGELDGFIYPEAMLLESSSCAAERVVQNRVRDGDELSDLTLIHVKQYALS